MKKSLSTLWLVSLISAIITISRLSIPVNADDTSIIVQGQRYEFGEKSSYEITSSSSVGVSDTSIGTLNLLGDMTENGTIRGV